MDNIFGFSVEQMLGVPTIHLPMNIILQDAQENKRWGIWQSDHEATKRLRFGSKKTHVLILGDAFIRPRLVLDSNKFEGAGAAHIACSAFHDYDKWQLIFER